MSTVHNYIYSQSPLSRKPQKPKRNFVKENIKQLQNIKKPWENPGSRSLSQNPKKYPKWGLQSQYSGYVMPAVPRQTKEINTVVSNISVDSRASGDSSMIKPLNSSPGSLISFTENRIVKQRPLTSTACQTVDMEELRRLQEEGVVRGAAKGGITMIEVPDGKDVPCEEILQEHHAICKEKYMEPITAAIKDCRVDFVKLNALAEFKDKFRSSKPAPPKLPASYKKGVVPKYIQERKAASNESMATDDEALIDPDCPNGHVLMSDRNRKEHLEVIRKYYSTLIIQLNSLPVSCDSNKAKQRKIQLEKELEKMEQAIKLFSREKLYVRVGPLS